MLIRSSHFVICLSQYENTEAQLFRRHFKDISASLPQYTCIYMHCDTCTTDHHHDYNYMKPSHDFLKYRYVNDCIFSALSGWMVHVPVWRDHVHWQHLPVRLLKGLRRRKWRGRHLCQLFIDSVGKLQK